MAPLLLIAALCIVAGAAIFDRDVQHHSDDNHGGQECRPGEQQPVMSHVLDMRTTQFGHPQRPTVLPRSGTQHRPVDRMTFVQVHTASLAWAPFIAGCDNAGNTLHPVAVDGTKHEDLRSSW